MAFFKRIIDRLPSTINNRLAAIRSFMQYISEVEPEYSSIVKRTLILPMQKTETVTMEFISKEEFNVMISVCDTSSLIGSRDKLMLMILYNTGVRVSELLGIRCYDIQTSDVPGRMNIKIHGKGRKERIVPLWKDTAQYIRKYISFNGLEYNSFLFINKNGDKLTRSGVKSRISYITKQASSEAAGLCEKNVTPHTFRHSVAMNLLRSGIDISTIAIWLGHSSIETTHKYMVADMEIKRKAMDKAGTAGDSYYSYTPSHDILSFLKSL